MTLAPGSHLGTYEIVASIGAGGMGEVYRARDSKLGRDVAIKVMAEAMTQNADGLARFNREARAVATLNHPHIVTIFSTEEADGMHFMTMELVEGRTLNELIPREGMSLRAFLDVAIPLVEALQAAHLKNITHRDLKPGNVMVTDEGRIKVLDFGLAVNTGRDERAQARLGEENQVRTKAGLILGTAPYMSPEQIEARPLDHRTDLFSLGVMMYEMVTGTRPFQGDTWPATMASILKEEPKHLAAVRKDLPPGLSNLVAACLTKDVSKRTQSASEALQELRAVRRAYEAQSGPGTADVLSPLLSSSSAPAVVATAPVALAAPTRVLIVDDDVSLCRVLTDYLGPLGYEVESVADGQLGLSRALSGEFAAVILDVRLPGLNGIEVLRRIRERSRIRVILWSSMGEEPDRVAGLEIGADDYLPKSSSPRELLARLRSVLRR